MQISDTVGNSPGRSPQKMQSGRPPHQYMNIDEDSAALPQVYIWNQLELTRIGLISLFNKFYKGYIKAFRFISFVSSFMFVNLSKWDKRLIDDMIVSKEQ